MRLFVAIDLPGPVEEALNGLVDQLRPTARIQWSPPSNLHITTKFIGDWPDERLTEVQSALAALPSREPIPIEIRGLGWFPNSHNPRVFWAAVQAPAALATLVRDTEAVLEPLGIPRDERRFSPHLTLARIKAPTPLQPLRQAIAGLPSFEFGSFTAAACHLYRSQLSPGGSVYTKLCEYPLRKS